MKPSPSYLTRNRHGTFYFRIVIPRPLRALLHGQREVRRTLKTDSERLARSKRPANSPCVSQAGTH
ncbi:DUF6538 domain-containing protein [Pseudomonas aeruginosa]|uniref:DUF6538 domain-containing protein n=1 Tax=Pseudomonas aeruginosa TaxID=287 RepID=UPI003D9C77CE